MSNSHNPVMNRMLPADIQKNQAEIDAQFDSIVSSQKMTVGGTAIKIAGLFVLLLTGAMIAWNVDAVKGLMIPAVFVALGLAMWISFSKKVRPGAVIAYALVEGVFVGTISYFFEQQYPGIVMNAVLGTLTTAGAMFTAYSMGWIRVTSRFSKVMTFALIGYAGFGLVNLIVGMFTNSAGIYSSQYGWVAGLIGVGLAAFTLNLDFEDISQGAAQGLPREFEWRAAFGLLVTMVWLYLEILRLLAIFNRD
ncbi:MAG: Bax inhibitor-1/YccA family protein [Actinobacteria bacterium]|nr:Bax inhibitor-1/YccA family protein [Actinomycetota bacterium]